MRQLKPTELQDAQDTVKLSIAHPPCPAWQLLSSTLFDAIRTAQDPRALRKFAKQETEGEMLLRLLKV